MVCSDFIFFPCPANSYPDNGMKKCPLWCSTKKMQFKSDLSLKLSYSQGPFYKGTRGTLRYDMVIYPQEQ